MDRATLLYEKINNGHILHKDVILNYLRAFSDQKLTYKSLFGIKNIEKYTQKKQIRFEQKLNAEKDKVCIQALRDIVKIWEDKGEFVDHKELYKQIAFKKIEENISDKEHQQKYKNFTKEMLDASYDLDTVSGFYDKNSAHILEALAHIYKKAFPEVQVVGAGCDIGNQTAANTKIGEEIGDMRQGWKECDKAISISLNIYMETLKEYLGNSVKCVGYRKGGDEFGFLLIGNANDIKVAKEKLQNKNINMIISKARYKAEELYAFTNLHDMDHTKDPNNPFKKGMTLDFGYAHYEDLTPHEIQEEQEAREAVNKLINGYLRQGVIPPVMLRVMNSGLRAKYPKKEGEKFYPPEVFMEIQRKKEEAKQIAENNFKLANPKCTTAELLNNLSAEWDAYNKKIIVPKKPPVSTTKLKNDKRTRFENYSKTMEGNANLDFIENKCEINKYSLGLVYNLVNLYMAKDPSSGANPIKGFQTNINQYYSDAQMNIKETGIHQNSWILCVEIGNLQGANGFGHHTADRLLKHKVEIIKEVLEESGISNSDAIFTKGGGVFYPLLPSSIISKDTQEYTVIDNEFVEKLLFTIDKRIDKEINQKYIYDYFKENNIPTEYVADSDKSGIICMPNFTSKKQGEPIYNPKTKKKMKFSDLKHPRRQNIKGIFMVYSGFKPILASEDYGEKIIDFFRADSFVKQDADEQKFISKIKSLEMHRFKNFSS